VKSTLGRGSSFTIRIPAWSVETRGFDTTESSTTYSQPSVGPTTTQRRPA
jgi:hypothetical protein